MSIVSFKALIRIFYQAYAESYIMFGHARLLLRLSTQPRNYHTHRAVGYGQSPKFGMNLLPFLFCAACACFSSFLYALMYDLNSRSGVLPGGSLF